ncbi:Uncharacterized protein TCM_003890 [Theobroma cacao]|uniref:Uncharacterized protein n=1 Tax=Theobroma cacao TaxID=3641 RepID=A0A061DWB8_THECC|nr:Uncharacterized protein TCM_003890 [Theobroma cacao]
MPRVVLDYAQLEFIVSLATACSLAPTTKDRWSHTCHYPTLVFFVCRHHQSESEHRTSKMLRSRWVLGQPQP